MTGFCACSYLREIAEIGKDHPVVGAVVGGLAAIGLFKVITGLLSYFTMLADLFILPRPDLSKYGAGSGSNKGRAWAIVTGATAGIGEQFAHQLAAKGFNVGIISRTTGKLETVQKELQEKCPGVSVKYLAFDASKDEPESYTALEKFIEELDNVTVLINNVGQSHSIPVPFIETPEQEMRDIITINNIATLKITQIIAPKIIASTGKGKAFKRGLILTMGSFAGLTPTPLLATYSGSKAFLQSWSNALARELQPQGVDVQLVISYLVTSNMSKIRRTSALIPNPKQFVKSVFQSIGRRSGAQERYATTTPYWSHALLHWWMETAAGVFGKLIIGINYNMHVDIRKRALKKAERLAKQK
ncbi:ketoreductase [Sugiyamaella lignohabitans]|uniref:Very-long-chain 3-oxoacyl-CoA reductase n=1 Tax=Sugiyamaella lignohabitans TaxID=796027 RepID=A0A167E2V9_9ASCO|nr:ketoreductase [Sugiyamaella lignohabitans]ANB13575.1 ketoreductase [Sugiyamaella lignohabitans]